MDFSEVLSFLEQCTYAQLNEVIEHAHFLKYKQEEKAKEVQNFAREQGFELPESALIPAKSEPTNDGRRSVKPKYKYVDDDGKEYFWSGRGKAPAWAEVAKKEGTLEQYKI